MDELKHFGILGMKWGIRRYQPYPSGDGPKGKYVGKKSSPKSIRGIIAKRANKKVDASFKKWEEGAANKKKAIDTGKQRNIAKIKLDRDPGDKKLKEQYNQLNKQYKKDLKTNTAYRKGAVRQEVGRDLSRKYLSEAKAIQKKISNDPSNSKLIKEYNAKMDTYNIERAKARRAGDVGAARSLKIASLKRAKTKTVNAIIATSAIAAGTAVVNKHLKSRNIQTYELRDIIEKGRGILRMTGYIY